MKEFYMQKKIIALAIASALAAPAMALAETTIYGLASVSLDRVNDGAATNATTAMGVSAPGSRLGFKGSEDLSGGLSTFWMIETNVALDSPGTTKLGDRDAFAGLKSDSMGSVKLGSGGTPYRTSTRGLDLFDGTIASNIGLVSNGQLDGGAPNSITYASPDMGGFTVEVAKAFEEAAIGTGGTAIAAKYAAGPLYAIVAQRKKGTGPGNSTSGVKVGGSYSMDAFAVNLILEKMTDTAGAVEAKNTNLYLGGKFNISSSDAVKAAFIKRGSTTGATDDAKQITVGYDHNLSKDTMVYALYTKTTDNTTGAADPSAISFGMHKSF